MHIDTKACTHNMYMDAHVHTVYDTCTCAYLVFVDQFVKM